MIQHGNLYLIEDGYDGLEDSGLEGLGDSALVGKSGDTSVDYSNIGTKAATYASAAAPVVPPYGAIIAGVAGGLIGTTEDVLAVYETDDNAKNAVKDYMNAHRDNTNPNVLPAAPLYMNRWFIIIGLSVLGLSAGAVTYKVYRNKRKKVMYG